jgi:hypothetical protein
MFHKHIKVVNTFMWLRNIPRISKISNFKNFRFKSLKFEIFRKNGDVEIKTRQNRRVSKLFVYLQRFDESRQVIAHC